MRYILPLFIILAACSKPTKENATVDSTAVTADKSLSPPTEADPDLPKTTLTDDEMDRTKLEIFLFVRRNAVVEAQTAYVEDFNITGDKFRYTFMKHNGDNAGMQSQEYSGQYVPTQEEVDIWLADSINNPNPYNQYYTRHNYYFIPEIDTFYIEGKYIAYLESAPEATPRKITIKVEGECVHKNASSVSDDGVTVKYFEDNWSVYPNIFSIDFSTEHKFTKDDLYLKARVIDLTESDIAGLSKEELSLVRNDIFARHGHTFKTPKMVQRYASLDWYQPVIDDASKVLNKMEKRNVDFIKKREG